MSNIDKYDKTQEKITELNLAFVGLKQQGKSTIIESLVSESSRTRTGRANLGEGDSKIPIISCIKRNPEFNWKAIEVEFNKTAISKYIDDFKEDKMKKAMEKKVCKCFSEVLDISNKIIELIELKKDFKDKNIDEDLLNRLGEKLDIDGALLNNLEEKLNRDKSHKDKVYKDIQNRIDYFINKLGLMYELEDVDTTNDKVLRVLFVKEIEKINNSIEKVKEEILKEVEKNSEYLELKAIIDLINKSNLKEKGLDILEENNLLDSGINEVVGKLEYTNMISSIKRKLLNLINDLGRERLYEIDSIEISNLIGYIKIEKEMSELVKKRTKIDTLNCADFRGVKDSEDKGVRYNNWTEYDCVIFVSRRDQGNVENIAEIIKQMDIISINLDCAIVDTTYISTLSEEEIKEKNLEDINSFKKILKDSRLIPKDIEGYLEAGDEFSTALNFNFGNILPYYNQNAKKEDKDFYAGKVIDMVNKLVSVKQVGKNIERRVKRKLEKSRNDERCVDVLGVELKEEIKRTAYNFIIGENGHTEKKPNIKFRYNIRKCLKHDDWAWNQYMKHYMTEAGANILKETIKNINNIDISNKKQEQEECLEKIFTLKAIYRKIVRLPKYRAYQFANLNWEYTVRIESEFYYSGLDRTSKELDINLLDNQNKYVNDIDLCAKFTKTMLYNIMNEALKSYFTMD